MKLISGKTCGKCAVVERNLKTKNIEYERIWASENMEFCKKNEISELPTLVTEEGKFVKGLTNCLKYINV